MADKKGMPIEVRLLGQRISLRTHGEPEIVNEVVALVSQLLENAEKRSSAPVSHHVALLALLDLAEEYVRAKKRASVQQQKMDEKSSELRKLIDAEI